MSLRIRIIYIHNTCILRLTKRFSLVLIMGIIIFLANKLWYTNLNIVLQYLQNLNLVILTNILCCKFPADLSVFLCNGLS